MKRIIQKLFYVHLIVLSILLSGNAFAQRSVSGKITDSANGESLPGVSIVISGTTLGTITDMDGNFNLTLPANAGQLEISMIGYEKQVVKITDVDVINVSLTLSTTAIDEIVVTGYGGTQKRSKLTNSISSVKADDLEIGLYSNPAQALTGAVSGLKVTNVSGNPGAVPTITLRGGTNLNGTGTPLIVVDGQVRASLSDINPEDIESMDVLKDAGATALYGARANNGVLLITTKRGKEGRTEISVKSKTGLNYLNNPYSFMNAGDYLTWVRKGYMNAANVYQDSQGNWKGFASLNGLSGAQPYGTGNSYFDAKGNPLDGNKTALAVWSPMFLSESNRFLLDQGWQTIKDPFTGNDIIYSEFDRSSTAFNDPAVSQDYNISVSGGNEKGSYYAGIGYNHSEGLPAKTYYQRINFTFNGDYKIKEWLTSYSSFQYTDAKWYDITNTSEGNYFARMLSAPPTQREYNANGELLLGNNSGDGNPLYNIDKFKRNNNTDKFIMAQSFKFDIAKGLSLKLNANWLYDEGFYEYFNKDYLSRPGTMNTTRSSTASFSRTLSQTYNSVLNYNLNFAEFHTIDALAGFEYYDSYYKGFSAAGSGAPTDDFADLGLTSSKEGLRSIDSEHIRERIMSFFGRANYDFKDKYLASVTFRQDGYSRLLGDNRWGFFPGVSGGWVISKEDFMKDNNKIFSFMKLRASYGLNGNVSGIGAYTLQGSYNSTLYNNQVGYLVGSIPNPGLRWERSQTFEIGADFGFLENIINANLTYYDRLTIDKYASIPLPETSGISSITSNNGELRNRGIEADLSFKVLRKSDLKWDIGTNFAFNTNTIEKLPDNGLEKNRQGAFQVYNPGTKELMWVGGYQEGQSPGDLYVFMAEGIYKDAAQVAEIAGNRKDITSGNNGSNGKPLYGPNLWSQLSDADKAKGLPIQPGDVIWKDVNGDNIIDNYDLQKVGNVTPKFFGGLNTTLSYKGLKFYARMDYALGYKQLDNQAPWFLGMMQGTYNTLEETKQTWTPENTSAAYPIYTWADQLGKRNYARSSSMFVYNANYLAFREVSLIYSLPKNWMEMSRIGGVDISVTGQNLGYLTSSKLYTPENSSTSGTGGGYALPRTIIFGVDIRF